MAGTKLGVQKAWATRLGVTEEMLREKYAEGLSWCYMCRSWLEYKRFSKDRTRWDGLKSACRSCVRLKHVAWTYGLTIEEARKLRAERHCHICQREATKQLEIDHSHRTGKVRGVLCRRCNVALGNFLDNPEHLKRAIDYLEAGEWQTRQQ